MIPLYGLGIIALISVLILLSSSASNIRNALSLRQWLMGGGAILGISALLLISPRLTITAVIGLLSARILIALLRRMGGNHSAPRRGKTASANGTSSVSTEWLHATLDHDSGTMDAEILQGPYVSEHLSALTVNQLTELYAEMTHQGAHESMQIVTTFMDTHHPGWSDYVGGGSGQTHTAGASETTLTRAKALEILGLEEGADTDTIVAAHRRLIRAVHPDRGGSSYLAVQLNRARDFLLGGA